MKLRRSAAMVLLLLALPAAAGSVSDAELRARAATFPPMPHDTFSLSQLLGRTATFGSGGPFNDLEFTSLSTDYIDGENGGFDVFHPVAPGAPWPGADTVKYIRGALNTDLDARYGVAPGDRFVLGDARLDGPYFQRGDNGIDDDYAVLQHVDYGHGLIELAGRLDDYRLVYCALADGCATEGWYLFYLDPLAGAAPSPDLIAFVYPCDALEPSVSGNPPADRDVLCNDSRILSLDDPAQFVRARAANVLPVLPTGLLQLGSRGKELLGAVTADAEGNVYLLGSSDGDLDGNGSLGNALFVASTTPTGRTRWITRLPLAEGSMLKGATADGEFLYACGRTLDALPGFVNQGRWDGILLKLRLDDGAIDAMHQWGNPGIDGFGNCVLDDSGHLFVSGQGSPEGPATTDDLYLVARYDTNSLTPTWVALDRPAAAGFVASAEAWGRLAYRPGAVPGAGELAVSGWYMGPGGAEAFLAVYDQLDQPRPRIAEALTLGSQQARAEWFLGTAFDRAGRLYVLGYSTGEVGGPPLGEGDLFVIRYDERLANPLRRQFGTDRSEWGRSFGIDADDRLYVVANTFGDAAGANADPEGRSGDAVVYQLDGDLNIIATRQFGTAREDRALAHLGAGRLLVAGTTEGSLVESSRGSMDVYAVALEPDDLSVSPLAGEVDGNRFTLSGAWYEPETAGQGLVLEVIAAPAGEPGGVPELFGGWFTYGERAGGVETQAWYTLQGRYDPALRSFELALGRTPTGRFDDGPAVDAMQVGTARLAFESCTEATLDFAFFEAEGGASGKLRLERLLSGASCEADGESTAQAFLRSGAWFEPATAGQGLLLELDPTQEAVFGAWYTYPPDGDGHRWFTLQGAAVPVPSEGSVPLEILASVGGRLDQSDEVVSRTVGEATLVLGDCRSLELRYRFDSGELAGSTGQLALERVAAPPPGCSD